MMLNCLYKYPVSVILITLGNVYQLAEIANYFLCDYTMTACDTCILAHIKDTTINCTTIMNEWSIIGVYSHGIAQVTIYIQYDCAIYSYVCIDSCRNRPELDTVVN